MTAMSDHKTLSETKWLSERKAQSHSGSLFVLLILFALSGAFACAAAAYALGQPFGIVLLAYAVGGSGFYLAGALAAFLAVPRI